jgi:hypothetical protein
VIDPSPRPSDPRSWRTDRAKIARLARRQGVGPSRGLPCGWAGCSTQAFVERANAPDQHAPRKTNAHRLLSATSLSRPVVHGQASRGECRWTTVHDLNETELLDLCWVADSTATQPA